MTNIEIGGISRRSYILKHDLELGKEIIYFGEPTEYEFDLFKNDENMEKNIEGVINHELCHIVIYKITNNILTCSQMDNVDNPSQNWPISGSFFAIGGKQ